MFFCNTITFENLDVGSLFLSAGTSSEDTGQVRIWRSSGQGQGYISKSSKFPIPAM